MSQDYKLVYSTDPTVNQKCPKCKELLVECSCKQALAIDLNSITTVLRIEKSGRNGKVVTVLDKLPNSESFLKELCAKIKKKCGVGGTHLIKEEIGLIEIQGDKKELIKKILVTEKIKFKG